MAEKKDEHAVPPESLVNEKTARIIRDMAAFFGTYWWIKPAGGELSVSVESGREAKRCPDGCPNLFEWIYLFVDLYGGGNQLLNKI